MLLTITSTHQPATDLGYLLGKNPTRTQSFELTFGQGHVYYPEATQERCTAALLLDVDPVGLIRRGPGNDAFALGQYTNDRPYVASSFMSVAIGKVFNQALQGRSRDRQALADSALPLEVTLAVVPVRGGEALLRELFEPLGYAVSFERHTLDVDFPQWGEGVYGTVRLKGDVRLADLLRHLTVLIPVLDDNKHYWVGQEEIEKLLTRGEGWLSSHPRRETITTRYLKHQRALTRAAMAQLSEGEVTEDPATQQQEEDQLEAPLTLNEQRLQAVVDVLLRHGARRVADVGCGEGNLLRKLVRESSFQSIVGMDVSPVSLERAHKRLRLDEASERQRARVQLFQGSLTYRDKRLGGFDAACAIEVIEHIDPWRLDAFEHALFAAAAPACVVVTTPNAEYNVRFENLSAGKFRHRDHRFEWTRAQFERWANKVAERHGYAVAFVPIGPEDDEVGAPTQMGVFTR